ncbi:MAG: hypothetical protein R3E68_00590 [Burkholderiaceae bacterium]
MFASATADRVVHGVSVDIADGEFIVIVGLGLRQSRRCCAWSRGLEEIGEGTIEIAGRVVSDVEADRAQHRDGVPERCIRMMCSTTWPTGSRSARLPRAEIEARIDKAARMPATARITSSVNRAHCPAGSASGVMGRALVREPAAFLLDEPLSVDVSCGCRSPQIRDMQRKVNTTTLYVTPDQVEAMTLATRPVDRHERSCRARSTPLASTDAGDPVRRHLHRLTGDEPVLRPGYRP